ncbi:PucR family transcriptional regulator [Halanaerobaculum tunisiense]
MDTKRLFSLQNKYQKILLNNGGLRTLCNTLREEINNQIFILDKYQENIIYIDRKLRENNVEFYSYLNNRKSVTIEIIFNEFEIYMERIVYSWQQEEVTEVQIKLKNEDKVLGILSILEEDKLGEDDLLVIVQAVYALSLKLHQNDLIQNLAQKCSNELIDDLLQGKISSKEELVKRGELAGWDLTVSYQLFILRFESENKEQFVNNERTLYNYELEERIIRSLHRIIRANLSTKYIIFSYDSDILLLVHYEEAKAKIKGDIQQIYQKLQAQFDNIKFSVGAGGFVTDCYQIPRSYQQGLYTLDFLASTKQSTAVFFYKDLGVLRLLWQIDNLYLKQFTTEYLAELIKYDQQNNTNWVETLGIFLQEGGAIQQAAERLHIHPNTVRYRIKRMEEMIDLDLHDFENQLNLAIAYKINKFIGPNQDKGD